VRADNAIRMGGGVCVQTAAAKEAWNAVSSVNTRVVRLTVGAADCRSRGGEGVRVVDEVCTLYRRREVRLYTDGGREGG
jgi:hypothetical protein